jgi:hypothetical protein
MLFFVMGLPGRFSGWCDAVAAGLAERAGGPTGTIHADTLEELSLGAMKMDTSRAVIAARQPGGLLRRALIEAGRAFIVALDDPRAALADLVTRRGIEIATATRQVASSCACVFGLDAAPGALLLHAGRDGPNRMAAAAIARHLRFDLSASEIDEIACRLGDQGGYILDQGEIAAWWDGLDPGERVIAGGALGPYLGHSPGGALGPITWAAELFFAGDRPAVRATGGVDITGRARCLLRGPRIMLPPATWSLSVALEVSPDAAEHGIVVEATAGAVVGRTVIRPTGFGEVEANLTLALEDLSDHPIDLILSNERPAFGGHLTLLRVTLTPQPPAPE